MLERATAAAAWPGPGRMAAWRAHAYCEPEARDCGAGALRLEAARRPARRAPRDLLVRVHASSINPIDLAIVRGYGARVLNALRRLRGAGGPEFPLVPGRDFAGTVAGAAPGAALAAGARVWGVLPPHVPGAHAQYVVAHEDWVGPAPTTMDDLSAGGALYAALTACSALRAAGLAPGAGGAGPGGARVLLLGLGGVGHAALQLLAHDRHQVVVSCAPEQAEAARALGAEPRDRRRDDFAERLRQDGPFDAVLDCAGLGGEAAAALPAAFSVYVTLSPPLLRRADALGLVPGLAAAAAELLCHNAAAPPAPAPLAAPLARVRWAFFSPRKQDIELLRRRAEQGKFSVAVERAWGWRDGAAAYARAAARHARGKLLLDFGAPEPPEPPEPPAHSERPEPAPVDTVQ